jgi:hypothetical protein
MKDNALEFGFNPEEIAALAALIANLNKNEVPYSLRRDNVAIEITIKTGY